MGIKALILGIFILTSLGCATTRSKISTPKLQERVEELERQLQERDEIIAELRDELEKTRYEMAKSKVSSGQNREREEVKKPYRLSVKKIQLALKNAGFYDGPIDGKIGEKTRKAIKEFQKANGLTPDGIVGRRTIAKLIKYLD